jgi:hypothetical protein
MEQRADPRSAKFLRPKFGQMIKWQVNTHSVFYHDR